MIFISRALIACLLSITLAACSINTAKEGADSAEAADYASQPVQNPNPYLLNREPAPKRAQAEFDKAVKALREQHWSEARNRLLEITDAYPQLSGPWLNLGIAYLELEQPEQAEAAMQQAIEVNSNNLDAYNRLASLKRGQGDFVTAQALYQQALAVWPEHAASHLNLGILYDVYMGKFEQALVHYQAYQALHAEPDRRVAGWMIDLNRRPQVLAKSEQTQ